MDCSERATGTGKVEYEVVSEESGERLGERED